MYNNNIYALWQQQQQQRRQEEWQWQQHEQWQYGSNNTNVNIYCILSSKNDKHIKLYFFLFAASKLYLAACSTSSPGGFKIIVQIVMLMFSKTFRLHLAALTALTGRIIMPLPCHWIPVAFRLCVCVNLPLCSLMAFEMWPIYLQCNCQVHDHQPPHVAVYLWIYE